MSEQQDGGPAFPLAFSHQDLHGGSYTKFWNGMSLRDWFAGQALVLTTYSCDADASEDCAAEAHAKAAYRIADAMLVARSSPASAPADQGGEDESERARRLV